MGPEEVIAGPGNTPRPRKAWDRMAFEQRDRVLAQMGQAEEDDDEDDEDENMEEAE